MFTTGHVGLLTVNATKTLLSAFVVSKLDCCNSLLSGSLQHVLYQLQRKQNSTARLVMKSRKCVRVQPLLGNLHWLPVRSRRDYKISNPCFNTFTDSSPVYIAQLLSVYTPSKHSVHPRTHAFSVFLSSKLCHLVKEHFPSQA